MWRSLVSRLVRVQEASGSNPDTPTKKEDCLFGQSSFLLVSVFERLNATRTSVAADSWTEASIYLCASTDANETRRSDDIECSKQTEFLHNLVSNKIVCYTVRNILIIHYIEFSFIALEEFYNGYFQT